MDLVDKLSLRGFDCLCGNLRMAARAVTAAYDGHLRPAGLQASQLAVLWAVAGPRGESVSRIAAKLAMHDTALVRNLRVLEGRGWVSIEVEPTDASAWSISRSQDARSSRTRCRCGARRRSRSTRCSPMA